MGECSFFALLSLNIHAPKPTAQSAPKTVHVSFPAGAYASYYRYAASNAYGLFWAGQSASFDLLGRPRCRMNIQFSGYDRPEALTNFPALVTLGTNITGFSYGSFLSGANADLRFTGDGQTNLLNYEIERWDTNGQSYVWVQVPVLTNNARIWAFWSEAGRNAPYYATNGATWDASFAGVWHLGESGTVTRANSTANPYGATPTGFAAGDPAVTGKVGLATGFNASKYLSVATQPVYNLGTESGKQWTVSAWYCATGSVTTTQGIVGKRTGGSSDTDYALLLENSGLVWGTGSSSDLGAWWGFATEPARPQWHYVAGTLTATGTTSGLKWGFVDGLPVKSTNYTLKATTQTAALCLGALQAGSTSLQGFLDEVRVESVARSSNWIWACYMNQASNSLFATSDRVISGPAGTMIMFR